MAGGASQLMAFVHFSSLVRFRRGPPRRVDGQPTEPVLATTPGWAQSAQAPPSPPAGKRMMYCGTPLPYSQATCVLNHSSTVHARCARPKDACTARARPHVERPLAQRCLTGSGSRS